MELWIRSQNEERLMKINSLDYVEYNDKHVINGYGTNECDNYDLGLYKTKERALEVLDEIQRYIEKQGTNELLVNENGIVKGSIHYGNVYQMPKE